MLHFLNPAMITLAQWSFIDVLLTSLAVGCGSIPTHLVAPHEKIPLHDDKFFQRRRAMFLPSLCAFIYFVSAVAVSDEPGVSRASLLLVLLQVPTVSIAPSE